MKKIEYEIFFITLTHHFDRNKGRFVFNKLTKQNKCSCVKLTMIFNFVNNIIYFLKVNAISKNLRQNYTILFIIYIYDLHFYIYLPKTHSNQKKKPSQFHK